MILKQKTTKLFKMLLAFTLVAAFAVTALVGCASDETAEGESSSVAASTPTNESSESVSAESSVADESSQTVYAESSDDAEESDDASEPTESDPSSGSEDESSEPESSTPDEESSEPVIEPEIIGEGTKESPYLVFPDENMKLTTYEIGADETHFYGIYRVGGMNLTVNSEDLYIVCDGKKYTQKDGVLEFRVFSAMASEAIVFEITNTSTSKQAFELCFANPVGTYANPVTFNIGKDAKVSLPENDEVGYYYKHIAEKDGVIVFKLQATAYGILAVTNNRNSAQRTSEEDGSVADDGAKYVEIEVQKGDELIINVGALPNKRGKRPAIEITVLGEYK